MDNLQKEYLELLKSQHFDKEELDYDILDKHISVLSKSTVFSGSAVSIFDMYKKCHVYESSYHKELFKNSNGEYTSVQIHPDDYEQVLKNGIAAMKHIFMHNKYTKYSKLIRECRTLINGKYKRITEQIQILEIDKRGNIWLSLSIVDISLNQSPFSKVNSQLVNFKTGDIFSPLDKYFDKDTILSQREIEILKWIERGKLSKEIAEYLNISIHTVNTHRQRILEKLNVNNSIEAIKYAQTLGLLDT